MTTTRKPKSTPKPYHGWAVFDSRGMIYQSSIRHSPDAAKRSLSFVNLMWKWLKRKGYRVCKVTVTPEGGK